MSVILITEHNENIYNSTKKATTYHRKSPRYVSSFKKSIVQDIVKKTNKPNQKPYATMGLPQQPPPNPHEYLKKNEGIHYTITPEGNKKKKGLCLMPPIPTREELFKEEKARKKISNVNFIVRNVKRVLEMKSKEPEQKIVMSRFGSARKLSAGLEPIYIHSDTFGRMPNYLNRFIKIKQRDIQLEKDSTGTQQPKCRYITRQQREQLLAGLKQNWEELQKKYQGLPILTDTIPKMHRKSKLEADLKQLEKDIVLLERHPYIYVYNDNDLSK